MNITSLTHGEEGDDKRKIPRDFVIRAKFGSPEERRMKAEQTVYEMLPRDGSRIQMKELKKKAESIKMSSATLSIHLKELVSFGFVDKDEEPKGRIFYKKLCPVGSAVFPAGIGKVFSAKDMIEDVLKVVTRTRFQCPDLFKATIDANISSLTAAIIALIYTCNARYSEIPKGLEPHLAAIKIVEILEDMRNNSHELLDKQIDLIIRPAIHKLLDLEIATIGTALPPLEEISPLRAILASKGEKLVDDAFKKIEKSEKILDKYKQRLPMPNRVHE